MNIKPEENGISNEVKNKEEERKKRDGGQNATDECEKSVKIGRQERKNWQ